MTKQPQNPAVCVIYIISYLPTLYSPPVPGVRYKVSLPPLCAQKRTSTPEPSSTSRQILPIFGRSCQSGHAMTPHTHFCYFVKPLQLIQWHSNFEVRIHSQTSTVQPLIVWEWIKEFHPIHYNGCKYLSMLGLQLIHVSKRGPWISSWCLVGIYVD